MDLINVLIISTGFITFFLGMTAFAKNRSNEEGFAFFMMTIAIAMWSISMVFFRASFSDSEVVFWGKALYITASLIPALYLYFVIAFIKEKIYSKQRIALLSAYAPLLLLFIWPSVLVRGGEYVQDGHNIIEFGWGSWLYITYFSLFFIAGVYLLLKNYSKHDISKVEHAQTTFVLVGSTIPIVIASFTNLYPPHFGYFNLNWVGNVSIIFFVASIAFAMFRHSLFNIRIIATEVFTGVVILILFANIFSFNTASELVFNIFIFALTTVFGILLIRGTIREIRTLEELSETKSEFLSIASHQLRTPLSIIKGYLSLLREGSYGKLESKQLEVINKTYNTNEGMRVLVNDFLNLSRAEKGTLEYNFEETNIVEFVESIVEEFQMPAGLKDLELKYKKPDEDNPLLADMDKDKFYQVIANLIDNAIKYTEKGGILVRVSHEDKYSNYARIYVSDTGMGLTEKETKALFQSFKRNERGEKTNAAGSGLGLYVAKMITEDHGGKIWAESKGENKGTTFIVELPLANSGKNVQNKQDD